MFKNILGYTFKKIPKTTTKIFNGIPIFGLLINISKVKGAKTYN